MLPTAFSLRSDSQRTARVRLGSSLTAALLDGHFAHPGEPVRTRGYAVLSASDDARDQDFRNL